MTIAGCKLLNNLQYLNQSTLILRFAGTDRHSDTYSEQYNTAALAVGQQILTINKPYSQRCCTDRSNFYILDSGHCVTAGHDVSVLS
jgi:hypothetical protein